MSEFFRGWRRKFGLLTLVMACVAMAGWARSIVVLDIFAISTGQFRLDWIASSQQQLSWGTTHDDRAPMSPWFTGEPVSIDRTFGPIKNEWHCCGFGEFHLDETGRNPAAFSVIPYWAIVLPQTLLSAYLLLSKPRKSNQLKIIETIASEGK